MRTKILAKDKALEASNWTTSMTLVGINGRCPFVDRNGSSPQPILKHGILDASIALALLDAGLVSIEVTEHDIFDDPAFEKWTVSECRQCATRDDFRIYTNGELCWSVNQIWRHLKRGPIVPLAEAVNRLVEVGEVSE
jgi:hypothetical protein